MKSTVVSVGKYVCLFRVFHVITNEIGKSLFCNFDFILKEAGTKFINIPFSLLIFIQEAFCHHILTAFMLVAFIIWVWQHSLKVALIMPLPSD